MDKWPFGHCSLLPPLGWLLCARSNELSNARRNTASSAVKSPTILRCSPNKPKAIGTWSLHCSKHLCLPPGSIHKLTRCSVFSSTIAFEHFFRIRAEIQFSSFISPHRREFGKSLERNERQKSAKRAQIGANKCKKVQTSENPKHGTGNGFRRAHDC